MPIIHKKYPIEIRRFILSLTIPLVFITLFWLVKIVETFYGLDLYQFGIYPRNPASLGGIFLTPFLHGDWNHLIGNSISFFVLSLTLFYFYPQIALKVFFWLYLISHCLLWLGGRESWHIGSSVLVYGFAFFLFISGILRKYIPLMAISLMVIFLYGSMVWHLIPVVINDPVSWEGHLFGALTGAGLSFIYRNQGPTRPPWSWELDEDADQEVPINQENSENKANHNPSIDTDNQNTTGHSGFYE